jgi:hypothetical protein
VKRLGRPSNQSPAPYFSPISPLFHWIVSEKKRAKLRVIAQSLREVSLMKIYSSLPPGPRGYLRLIAIAVCLQFLVAERAHAAKVSINNASDVTQYVLPASIANEVHVIGVYETRSDHGYNYHPSGQATVKVKRPASGQMAPITLVLSSYEPNHWQLVLDPGVAVQKIILNGYHAQTISGMGSIPVVNRSNRPGGLPSFGNYAYQWPLSTGGSSTQGLLTAIESFAGTRISSFTGAYRATSFTVEGSAVGSPNVNARLGAGNVLDTTSPDLIYDALTGRVQLDLSDLEVQYPFGSGDIWWQHFTAQRLFVALANHDGSFSVERLPKSLNGVSSFGGGSYANANRIGYDSLSLRNWSGQLLDLGQIFPVGIQRANELRDYLAAAHFSTDRQNGEFDLVLLNAIPEPSTISSALLLVSCTTLHRRRNLSSNKNARGERYGR